MEKLEQIKKLIGFRGEEGMDKYISDMKDKGFDVLKYTINKELNERGLHPNHLNLTQDQTKFMMMLELQPMTLNEIWEDKEFQDEFIVKVFNGRIAAYKLEDMVDPKLFVYGVLVYGVDNPGKGNIFLIKLLEHFHKNGTIATINDLSMNIFPFGFYDDESCRNIIDYCIKPKVTTFSELY